MNLPKPKKTDHTWNIPTLVGLAGLTFTLLSAIVAGSMYLGSLESGVQAVKEDIQEVRGERFTSDQRLRAVEDIVTTLRANEVNRDRRLDRLTGGVDNLANLIQRMITERKAER